jgi:hypothetical protein
MKLIVVFPSKKIRKDDVILEAVDNEYDVTIGAQDWTLTETNIHAVQWNGTSGHIEYNDGTKTLYLTQESQVATYSTFFDTLNAAVIARRANLATIDTNFYDVGPLDRNTNTYSKDARSVGLVKGEQIVKQKQLAFQLLAETDWYVTRNQDNSTEIPTPIVNYRAAIRTAATSRCALIESATTTSEIEALTLPAYPTRPGDPDLYFYDVYGTSY